MKGFVVTALVGMLQRQHGRERVQAMLANHGLASVAEGEPTDYVPVATLVAVCKVAGREFNCTLDDLVEQFGFYIFGELVRGFPELFVARNFADFIESIEQVAHPEILRRFPDAEVPVITLLHSGAGEYVIGYSSKRPFTQLACGILGAASAYYGLISFVDVLETRQEPETGLHESRIRVRIA